MVPEPSELKAISLFKAISICIIFFPVIKCRVSVQANLSLCWDHWLQLFHEPYELSTYIELSSLLQNLWTKRKCIYLECVGYTFSCQCWKMCPSPSQAMVVMCSLLSTSLTVQRWNNEAWEVHWSLQTWIHYISREGMQ